MLNPFILKQAPIYVLIESEEDNDLVLKELEALNYLWMDNDTPTQFSVLNYGKQAILTVNKNKRLSATSIAWFSNSNNEKYYTVKDLLC